MLVNIHKANDLINVKYLEQSLHNSSASVSVNSYCSYYYDYRGRRKNGIVESTQKSTKEILTDGDSQTWHKQNLWKWSS